MTWEEAVILLKSQESQRQLVEDCYFDDPIEQSAERFYHSSEWKAVSSLISNISKGLALDVGTGRGISSYALAKDGWQVVALEPDASELIGCGAIKKLAEISNLPIEIFQSNGEKMPFENEKFDLVYGRQVLHHANDLSLFCKEAYRVLKPGGKAVFTREHVISNSKQLNKFLQGHPLHNLYGGENALKLNAYLSALHNSGLVIAQIIKPFSSDINLFPLSKEKLKHRTKLPFFLIELALHFFNLAYKQPGRLYSFICYKP